MDRLQRLVAAALAAFAGNASAQLSGAAPTVYPITAGAAITYPGTQGSPPASANRTTSATPGAGGGVSISDSIAFLGPVGAIAAVPATGAGAIVAARTLAWPGVAVAVGGCLGNPACVSAVAVAGVAVWAGSKWLEQHRIRARAEAAGAGLEFDPGAPTTLQSLLCYNGPVGACNGQSAAAAYILSTAICNGTNGNIDCTFKQWNNATQGPQDGTYTRSFAYEYKISGGTGVIKSGNAQVSGTFKQVQACPNNTNAGLDGRCPTDVWQPITAQQAADIIAARPPIDQTKANEALTAFNDWLHSGLPCPSCTPGTVNPYVPAGTAIQGPTTQVTTTNATGTTVATTVNTHPLSGEAMPAGTPIGSLGNSPYPWGKLKWGTDWTTTSVLTPSGGGNPVTTVTSSSTTATTAQAQADAKKAEAVTQCDKFPDSLGCATLGTAPAAAAMPASSAGVSWTADSGWGASTGACPALVQTQSLGAVNVFGFICQYLAGIRFAVIGCAGIMACFIFLGRID